MASEAELLALASRVEAASRPDRELDALVNAACCIGTIPCEQYPTIEAWASSALRHNWNFPRYTASLDAAMTLVPEGDWAEGSLSSPGQLEIHGPCTFDPIGKGWAATPALALTAACLRARAATMGGRDD